MRLPALQTLQGFYTCFEQDQIATTAQKLGLDFTRPENQKLLHHFYQQMMRVAAPLVSGITVDSEVALPLFLDTFSTLSALPSEGKPPGLIIRLDVPQIEETQAMPVFSPTWGVEHIANNYAVALLVLTYHPQAEDALSKKQLVAEVYDFCQRLNIHLLLKLQISDLPNQPLTATTRQEMQLQAIQELRHTCHLLAVEAPADPLATATITAELDIPWLMIGNQSNFEQFSDSLSQALENGASGFLAGSVFWSEMLQMRRADHGVDEAAIDTFINTQLSERLKTITQMVSETPKV